MTLSAQSCLNRLHERECLEYCMVLENNCNDNDKVRHCQLKFHQNLLAYPNVPNVQNIPNECRCLFRAPETREEKKEHDANLENKACWSKFCVKEGAPMAGQLIKNTWWNDRPNCKHITHCVVDMDDTSLDIADNAQVHVNNCGEEENQTSDDSEKDKDTEKKEKAEKEKAEKEKTENDIWKACIFAIIFIFLLMLIK